jgi:hypothetical protein
MCLVQEKKGRSFNKGKGRKGEGRKTFKLHMHVYGSKIEKVKRGEQFKTYIFGSRGYGRYFKFNLYFYP